MSTTNRDVILAARRGKSMTSSSGSVWSAEGPPRVWRYLPAHIERLFREREHKIHRTIYSYSTPIAVQIGELWIIPDVYYSPTTVQHQHLVHELLSERVPEDVSGEELDRVISRVMRYNRRFKQWVPGPFWIPGC